MAIWKFRVGRKFFWQQQPRVRKSLFRQAARDMLHQRALRKLGWRPVVVWECETEKLEKLVRLQTRLERTLPAAKDRKCF